MTYTRRRTWPDNPDRLDDYVFRWDGRDIDRCYLRTLAGPEKLWWWTIYGTSGAGGEPSLEAAQAAFKTRFAKNCGGLSRRFATRFVQNCGLLKGVPREQYGSSKCNAYEFKCMRLGLAVVAVAIISTDALAEGGIAHVVKAVPLAAEPEPLLPERCEFLEVRDGAKLWRGDCVSASPYARLAVPKFVAPKKKSWHQKTRLSKKSRRTCCARAARDIDVGATEDRESLGVIVAAHGNLPPPCLQHCQAGGSFEVRKVTGLAK
jgi:hypothetical protein